MGEFMKYVLSFVMLMSFSVIAQDSEYKYEPEGNAAEYYIGHYKQGADLDDLIAWYGKFAAWAEDKDVYDEMTCLLYTSPSPRDRQKSRMPSSA